MKVFQCERKGQILQAVIFWGVVVLTTITAIPYGTVDAPWESLFEAAVFGFTILWIVEGWLTGSFFVREHRLLLPLLALVVFASIQSLTFWQSAGGPVLAGSQVSRALSVDPFETWRFALKLLAITLTLGMMLRYTSSVERVRILVYTVIGVALASAIFGLLRPEIPRRLLGFGWIRLVTDSSYGQFENRNHFALLMEMGIGLLLGLVAFSRGSRVRLLCFLLLVSVLWAALLLTHSRGGVLSLLVEIPVFFVLYRAVSQAAASSNTPRGKTRARQLATMTAIMCFVVAAIAASVIVIGGDQTIYRLESTPSEFAARSGLAPKVQRPQIWLATLKLIKDHSLLGVGFGGYSVAIPRYLNSTGEWTPQQAHNEYLEVLASGGAVGGVLSGWFAVLLIRSTCQGDVRDYLTPMAFKCGALAGLLAIAVHSFFDFGLHITVNALLCCALVVIAVKRLPTLGKEAVMVANG